MIKWTEAAATDLTQAVEFIRQDDAETAALVARKILSAVEELSHLPGRGRPGRVKDTRELVLPALPYVIVYSDRPSEILIVRILHSRRRWP